MHPYVNIFGKPFSSYGLVAFAGMIFAVLYGFIVHKVTKDRKDFFDRFIFIVYGAAFGALGAVILFQLTVLKGNIEALKYLFSDFEKFKTMFSAGLVFYGGMIGFFIGFMVYSHYFKEDTRSWVRTCTPGFVLFHAFGRIGCTVGGCCFGKVCEWHQNGMDAMGTYPMNDSPMFHGSCVYNARIGAYCIPIQLIESAGLVLIFIILLIFLKLQKNKEAYYKVMGLYFVLYGALRFVLEFYRGDLLRGIWGPFSTSQWISLIIFPIGIYLLICPTEKNILEKWYNGAQYKKDKKSKTEDVSEEK